jgi:hypothetical protein
MKFIYPFAFSIFILNSCDFSNHNHSAVKINYDFDKGFDIDTFKLSMDKKEFASLVQSVNSVKIDCYSFMCYCSSIQKI